LQEALGQRDASWVSRLEAQAQQLAARAADDEEVATERRQNVAVVEGHGRGAEPCGEGCPDPRRPLRARRVRGNASKLARSALTLIDDPERTRRRLPVEASRGALTVGEDRTRQRVIARRRPVGVE